MNPFSKSFMPKLIMNLVGAPLLKKFTAASLDAQKAEQEFISRLVAECRDTRFGKDNGFDKIKTVQDYRKALPVRTFEDFRPYIDRMCKGAADELFPGKPLIYNTTSGTTSKPKLIPISPQYLQNVHNTLSRLWLYTCSKDNPGLFNGKSFSAVSPAEEGRVEDGTPYGSISGITYKNIPGILKKTYSTPYPVLCIKDYSEKYYAMMRCALAESISYIICPSPSNLLRFHATIIENFDDMIKDIHDGTLRKSAANLLHGADKEEVLAYFKPKPKRAHRLETLRQRFGSDLRPRHYWPDLACLNIWKQGNFRLVLPQLEGYFDQQTVMRTFGYFASETRGVVLSNDWDYAVLPYHLSHYEFIEEQQRETREPRALSAHEVEVGKRYYLIFSNGTGLYRYDINDLIEIAGFYNRFPLIKFIQKGEGVTSLSGEKLTELQVIQAVQDVMSAHNIPASFYRMYCDEQAAEYVLYAEFAPETPAEAQQSFAAHVDTQLQKLNREYAGKRGSQRLKPPVVRELSQDSAQKFKEALIARGTRDGQYKECYLTRNTVHLQILKQLQK
ncbi:MAG: hypothetical protein GF398_15465 [Chitinivibrionales bacterium]|nr:hypothetical protein [Chitinivibrionales bacterium]